MINFSETEIRALQNSPVALRALADIHDYISLEADAIGDWPECVKFHDKRAFELRQRADEIEKDY